MTRQSAPCRLFLSVLFFLLLYTARSLSALEHSAPVLFPVPDWVSPLSLPEELDESFASSYGYHFILNDQQYHPAKATTYRHFAWVLTSPAGLESASRIYIPWQVRHETLEVHFIRVVRNGERLDWKDRARVEDLHREDRLDSGIYDEERTRFMVLEDIRVGDIVEYAYSLRGANPVFGGQVHKTFVHGQDYPMALLHFRLLLSPDSKIKTRQYVRSIEPVERLLAGGWRELVWMEKESPAVKEEDQSPYWFDTYPWIETSDWASWEELGQWGLGLFRNTVDTESRLAVDSVFSRLAPNFPLDDGVSRPASDDELLALIRFVQDEIRYFGLQIGEGTHRPRSPADIVSSGFGDCKDKTVLLCALLSRAGVKAWPALVATRRGQFIPDRLPGPGAFDHAICAFELDGALRWIDPTISLQGGDLRTFHNPDYGRAFLLDPAEPRFVPMEARANGSVCVEERMRSQGLAEEGSLLVQTGYSGAEADAMRRTLAGSNGAELEERYLSFYRSLFPKIRLASSLRVEDDRLSNKLRVFEEYTIPDLWSFEAGKPQDDDRDRVLELYPYTISDYFTRYARISADRTTPLALPYPVHSVHTSIVELHEEWDVEDEREHFADDWYRLDYRVNYADRTLSVTWDYQTIGDHVEAADVPAFLEGHSAIGDTWLGYILRPKYNFISLPNAQAPSTPAIFMLFVTLVLLLFLARNMFRRTQPSSAPPTTVETAPPTNVETAPPTIVEAAPPAGDLVQGPNGIGGVLAFLLVAFVLGFAIKLFSLKDWEAYTVFTWMKVSSMYNMRGVGIFLLALFLEILINLGLTLCIPLLLILAFKRSSRFKTSAIFFYLAQALLWLLYIAVAQSSSGVIPLDRETTTLGVQAIFGSGLWIAYLANSRRVANTMCR